jgi:hypothetical protein
MDHTAISKMIEKLERSDAASAADVADGLAEALALILDPDKETSA